MTLPDLKSLDAIGLRWHASGQSTLSGPLLALVREIDSRIVDFASHWGVRELQFPSLISARELKKVDYFKSFPHLATFATCLEADEDNLSKFAQGSASAESDAVVLTRQTPTHEIMTPAACYHVYIHEQGSVLDRPRFYTTRNTCVRREVRYEPLRRQWTFSMREIVCIGNLDEVRAFLEAARDHANALLAAADLPVEWTVATDPFFQPSKQGKYLAQRLNPTKYEAIFGDLAIASINLHQDHFGSSFDIARDGRAAFSGCLAFGLERWLYAVLTRHGADPKNWPLQRPARAAQAGDV
jgi:seryl-tRNA synthetase